MAVAGDPPPRGRTGHEPGEGRGCGRCNVRLSGGARLSYGTATSDIRDYVGSMAIIGLLSGWSAAEP